MDRLPNKGFGKKEPSTPNWVKKILLKLRKPPSKRKERGKKAKGKPGFLKLRKV